MSVEQSQNRVATGTVDLDQIRTRIGQPLNLRETLEQIRETHGDFELELGQRAEIATAQALRVGEFLSENTHALAAARIAERVDPSTVFAALVVPGTSIGTDPVVETPPPLSRNIDPVIETQTPFKNPLDPVVERESPLNTALDRLVGTQTPLRVTETEQPNIETQTPFDRQAIPIIETQTPFPTGLHPLNDTPTPPADLEDPVIETQGPFSST